MCKKQNTSLIKILLPLVIFSFSCKKQNEPVALVLQEPYPLKSDAYYANLRAFKKSNHQISFGWFSGLGAAGSGNSGNTPAMSKRIESLPDSVDIVSLFEGLTNIPALGSLAHSAMVHVQELKGTRFLYATFGSGVDRLRLKNFPNLPELDGIDSVAKSIADTVARYNLDGFDLDYEPSYGDGGIFGHGPKDEGGDIYTQRLFKALSKYLGPLSGTGKLLMIDGENEPGIEPFIDYYAQQAYSTSTSAGLQQRLDNFGGSSFPPEKFIPCEWLGEHADTFDGEDIPSYLGFAAWKPIEGTKGGAGLYGVQGDYNHTFPFAALRQMIQIMNPASN